MSWRIRVEHTTNYQYAGEVRSSYNEARITPLTTVDQLVLEAAVQVSPPTKVYRYLDYWSSVVHAFDIDTPHTELSVVGHSIVETSEPTVDGLFESWDDVDTPDVADDWAELLAPTPIVAADDELAAVAADIRQATTPASAGPAIIEWVRNQVSYLPGTTGVHTSAVEAWRGGSGVCQDFAHLTLAVARSMGLPARYCSGYLHPDPQAGIAVTVEGESHAWVELWSGDWHGYDPTSGSAIGERHVLVARGRDYSDVSPMKGVFNGGPATSLQVRVDLTRLA
jgi:transglutaminase-like putative cysteine protease